MYKQKRSPRISGTVLFSLGICLCIAGIVREEHMVVMRKAIRICLECIGIG